MVRTLGGELFKVRRLRGLSLKAVAGPAGLSATYLQKLENGDVESPSPHNLYRLAQELNIDYGDLFELAGYPLPIRRQQAAPPKAVRRRTRGESLDAHSARGSLLRQAFVDEVSDDELDQLARYLRFLRQEPPSS